MPYVDVDVDDFLRECSSRDIKELIEYLREDGYLPNHGDISMSLDNIHDQEWYDILKKLAGLRLQMSLEDIETVKQIVKKY